MEAQATDDWRLFMAQHAGHRLETLQANGEKPLSEGSSMDPMSVGCPYGEMCQLLLA